MIRRQTGLGRGLSALIPQQSSDAQSLKSEAEVQSTESGIREIPVDIVDPNPHQPRKHFDHGDLEDLVSSIKEHGILQPIVVTGSSDQRYELIVGERRLRAARISGLRFIPAVVREATDQQKMELALIENVQRADLNPIEEAEAYVRLKDEFGLTQDEVGRRVGKSRPQVANMIRLLQLPEDILQALVEKKISQSNARTLLSMPTEEQRADMFQSILSGNFTVRQTEARVPHPTRRRSKISDPNLVDLENSLRDALGAKVIIKKDARGEGEVRIKFFSEEDLQAVIKKITSN
ncbi:MAG: ParB/RepB/Spo0J family partition protein [Patescibacteria group bacterium]|nr:ParB/RepB/Spo0J family partition protein [Patescibacteria group bacterium]MBU2508946.1 ParB/RepB/Spo0J family partition protein [Patescibacteria group bacterium]